MIPEQETGRYRLREQLVPDSNVWLAEDLEDPTRQVVVKVLPESADSIAARHLVESLSGLSSPFLNKPLDDGELPGGAPFVVYPFVEGQTLREYLNSVGPLSTGVAGGLIRQLGSALGELHDRGIVHGAVAPEHIVLRAGHGLTLLNTGAFRVAGETSSSPAYRAPEHLAGNAAIASDIFSFAAVAAEMVTGRRVFRYGSLPDLAQIHQRGLPRGALRKQRARLPVRFEEEIRRGLAWDVAQRPSDVRAYSGRLAESLGGSAGISRRRLAFLTVLGAAATALSLRNCRRR